MLPPIAGRFVAGETAPEAIQHAHDLDERGVGTILNLLGEHYHERGPPGEDTAAYLDLLADIERADVDVCISVKPSQLGLFVDEALFQENLARIVDRARAAGVFVWIDMEDHTTTDATVDAFEHHASADAPVGVCLQANLRRTREDVRRLADLPGKVRLVKGAYDPPADIAYTDGGRVNEVYRELLAELFETYDGGIAVGSHDPAMIAHAERLHEETGTPFEIQMLMGVREDAQVDLAADYPVYQYAPFGGKWLSYFYRRVRERTDNLAFALRGIAGS
jgi:proline dehydrogenase